MCFPLLGPNGIGISPDGKWLYVAESFSSDLIRFEIAGPGVIRPSPGGIFSHGEQFVGSPSGKSHFDSLAVDSSGRIVCATQPVGLTIFETDGGYSQISLPDPRHDQHLLRRGRSANCIRYSVRNRSAPRAAVGSTRTAPCIQRMNTAIDQAYNAECLRQLAKIRLPRFVVRSSGRRGWNRNPHYTRIKPPSMP